MIGIQATNYWDNVVHPRINPSFEDSCLPIISGEIGDGLLMASPHKKKKHLSKWNPTSHRFKRRLRSIHVWSEVPR
jgi:hypothetical protein